MPFAIRNWKLLGTVLIDPVRATRAVAREPSFQGLALATVSSLLCLGVATLPRQLTVLRQALGATGHANQDLHYSLIAPGLTRVIVADRLFPSPTLLLAACALVVLAEPLLALARDRRGTLWALAVLGLAPLLVQAIGELLLAYSGAIDGRPTPGMAVSLANGFHSGPQLLWPAGTTPPKWLVLLDARLNLISLWCVALWSVGLRTIDGGSFRGWHLGVPMASLAVGAVSTWVLGPVAIMAVLGRP